MKITLLAAVAIGIVGGYGINASYNNEVIAAGKEPEKEEVKLEEKTIVYRIPKNIAGNYLVGRHAQSNHDWQTAEKYLTKNLKKDKENSLLLKRSMMMAMGSGNYDKAVAVAEKINSEKEKDDLATIFITLNLIKQSKFEKALETIESSPDNGIGAFIKPMVISWAKAGNGEFDVSLLVGSSSDIYHSVLIAAYMDKLEKWEDIFEKVRKKNISSYDLERVADHLVRHGKNDLAYSIYETIIEKSPKYKPLIEKKINAIKSGDYKNFIKDISVKSPSEGLSFALYDISLMLFRENSDDSARIFTSMALYLMPDMTESRLLMANIASRNKRIDKAIEYYTSIDKDDPLYLTSRRFAADILSEEERFDESIEILRDLVANHKDVKSQIMIGDLLRLQENYKKSLKEYKVAFDMVGDPVPDKYWHLYYSRGIAFERLKKWKKAEDDFLKALEYQPDNAYVLNYLGYSWADKGLYLDKALEMIEKAAKQSPDDAYIIDSLGWVLYKMEKYKASVFPLERAVKLDPYEPVINDHLGDSYWRVGRKLEARFQWKRALSYANEDIDISAVEDKIKYGIRDKEIKKAEIIKSND